MRLIISIILDCKILSNVQQFTASQYSSWQAVQEVEESISLVVAVKSIETPMTEITEITRIFSLHVILYYVRITVLACMLPGMHSNTAYILCTSL